LIPKSDGFVIAVNLLYCRTWREKQSGVPGAEKLTSLFFEKELILTIKYAEEQEDEK